MNRIKHTNDEIEKFNAKLISLFLFQYSILVPLTILFNATILVGIFSSMLLLFAVIGNRRICINPKILLLFFVILFLILIKIFVYQNGGYSVLFSYLTVACPALYIISLPFDKEIFMKTGYKLAIVSFFLIFWIPFFSVGVNYMRFGYGMAPTAVFLYCQLAHHKVDSKRKKMIVSIFICSLVELLVFGARGSLIPVVFIIIFDVFVINRVSYRIIVPLILSVLVYFNVEKIINFIFLIIDNLNIRSYSLIKIRRQIVKGFASASSGRDVIYGDTIDKIKRSPFLGNDLVGGIGDSYTHNIFLQITEEFGFFAPVVFLAFLLLCVIKIFNKKIKENDRLVLAVLFSLSIGRLLFSSSYWMRPEFWLFVGFGLIVKKGIKEKGKRVEDEIIK